MLGVSLPEERFSNYVPGRYLLFPTIQVRSVSDLSLSEYLWGSLEIQKRVDAKRFIECNLSVDACIKELVGKVGKKLFHRPLSDQEMIDYVQLGANEGVSVALAAMTLSPNFLYLSELGEQGLPGNGYQLSQYEIANALAYGYTGRGPDEQLWSMAEEDSLDDPSIREIQARRLIKSEAGKAYLAEFFMPLLEVSEVKLVAKEAIIGKPLITTMKEELKAFVSEVVAENPGGLDELLNPGFTFVNKALAKHYGMDTSGLGKNIRKVSTRDQQGGLLNLGIFHTANSDKVSTHPMIRARVVRENLLCAELGTPVARIPMGTLAPELASTREYWTAVTGPEKEACWGMSSLYE